MCGVELPVNGQVPASVRTSGKPQGRAQALYIGDREVGGRLALYRLN